NHCAANHCVLSRKAPPPSAAGCRGLGIQSVIIRYFSPHDIRAEACDTMIPMETRTLAQTSLNVSRACFGTMTFGLQADHATSGRMVDLCLDRGVNFFDTANAYGNGVAETMLGAILKGRRQEVVLASKVRMKMGDAPDESGLSRAAILKAIDQSLRRLQTDYLDPYYLHAPDWETPLEETLEAMDRLVRAGKIRYPASSNYAGWQ